MMACPIPDKRPAAQWRARAEAAEADKARLEARVARWKRAAKNERREYEALAKSNDTFSQRFDELRRDLGLSPQSNGSAIMDVVTAAQRYGAARDHLSKTSLRFGSNHTKTRHAESAFAAAQGSLFTTLDRLDRGGEGA